MTVDSITVPLWFDRHLHVRDGTMLRTVLPCTLNQRATGAVIMGNLPHPNQTSTIASAIAYRERIKALLPPSSGFTPCMTCYLTDGVSPEEVVRGFQERVWCGVKLYMARQDGTGGTTGAQHGVRDLRGRCKVFEAMEKNGIPLLGHFEAVEGDVDEFDREIVSVDRHLKPLLQAFPNLPVVFEHVTDGRAADFVAQTDHHVYATVTAHHLVLNRSDMFDGGMNPGRYCKPVPKREDHRRRIRQYVTSGNFRFGAGTDSAPHDESAKSRCYGCAAGIFTAPHAVELYATVFDEDGALQHLPAFLSVNFLSLYGREVARETMEIRREPLVIPEKVGSVPVFMGGKTLPWKLVVG